MDEKDESFEEFFKRETGQSDQPTATLEVKKSNEGETFEDFFSKETGQKLTPPTGRQLSLSGSSYTPVESATIGSGPLGSGRFIKPTPTPETQETEIDKIAKIPYADQETRGFSREILKSYSDPKTLKEIEEKVQWYRPTDEQLRVLQTHDREKTSKQALSEIGTAAWDAFTQGPALLESMVKGGVGIGKDLTLGALAATHAPIVNAFGDQAAKDRVNQMMDKGIVSSRVLADAALGTGEAIIEPLQRMAKGGSSWTDSLLNADKSEEELFQNYKNRYISRVADYEAKEINPAVLARFTNWFSNLNFSGWDDGFADPIKPEEVTAMSGPLARDLGAGVISLFSPSVEARLARHNGDRKAAAIEKQTEDLAASNEMFDSAIARANQLKEDPEQVGFVGLVTPFNEFAAAGMLSKGLGAAAKAGFRGAREFGKTAEEINLLRSAQAAAAIKKTTDAAQSLEKAGMLERALEGGAKGLEYIEGKGTQIFERVPEGLRPFVKQGAVLTGLTGLGAALADDEALGVKTGALLYGASKLPGVASNLMKARRIGAGAGKGMFETAAMMPNEMRATTTALAKIAGKKGDWIVDTAKDALKSNIHMAPLALALGIYNDEDAAGIARTFVEGGYLVGSHQLIGKIMGRDPIAVERKRKARNMAAEKALLGASPDHRKNVDDLTWDRVVEQRQAVAFRAAKAHAEAAAENPDSDNAKKLFEEKETAERLYREAMGASVETRQRFAEEMRGYFGDAEAYVNGSLSPGSNTKIELLTTEQIKDRFRNSGGIAPTEGDLLPFEKSLGQSIAGGRPVDRPWFGNLKDQIIINFDKLVSDSQFTGEALPTVLSHEIGHDLWKRKEYRTLMMPAYTELFGDEKRDENGNVVAGKAGIYDDEILFGMYGQKYLADHTPETVKQFAIASGLWDFENNTINRKAAVQYMREEVLADAMAGNLFGPPDSPIRAGLKWVESKITSASLKRVLSALNAAGVDPSVGEASGAVFTPEIRNMVREANRLIKQHEGIFEEVDPENIDPQSVITKKDILASKDLLQKYHSDSGKFVTRPSLVVIDADGTVIGQRPITTPNVFEGQWDYAADENGEIKPVRKRGYGPLPPEAEGMNIPDGATVRVQREIAYDNNGKPIEKSNRETRDDVLQRNEAIRAAIVGAADGTPGEVKPFTASGMSLRGKLTQKQRSAIMALPESIVPLSIKEKLFKVMDTIAKDDGSRLNTIYAARLNERGGYTPFAPEMRDFTPVSVTFSKDGNFLANTFSVSGLTRKLNLWKQHMPGKFAPWNGDMDAFKSDFQKYLKNWEPIWEDADGNRRARPGQSDLDVDPQVAIAKKNVFNDLIGVSSEEFNPEVSELPRKRFTRAQKKRAKQSDPNTIFRSYRLDAMTDLVDSPVPEKYRIDYGLAKINFMPEAAERAVGVEEDYSPVPTQEQLDKMKERLPKYTSRVEEMTAYRWQGNFDTHIYIYPEGSEKLASSATVSQDPSDPELLTVFLSSNQPGFQKQGYGEALYREIAKYAQSVGATKLYGAPVSRAATLRREKLFDTETGRPYPQGGYTWASSQIPTNVRFKPAQEDPTMVGEGFYSQAGRVLLDKMPNKASAEQLKGILDPQKGSGVKADELKWSGFIPFIESVQKEKGAVTKTDVEQFLRDSYAAKFETQTMRQNDKTSTKFEVTYGGDYEVFDTYEDARQAMDLGMAEVYSLLKGESDLYPSISETGEWNIVSSQTDEIVSRTRLDDGSYHRFEHSYESEQEAQDAIDESIQADAESMVSLREKRGQDPTQYSDYMLPNGKNYEETVLRMPNVKFTSNHFSGVPNYVAHMRTAEHGTGLLVEELQSDLHQKARKKDPITKERVGYKEPVPIEKIVPKMEQEIADLTKERTRLFEQYKKAGKELRSMPADLLTEAQKERADLLKSIQENYADDNNDVNTAIDEVRKQIEDYKSGKKVIYKNGIEDAPFRNDWPLQLFKYALQKAVSTGKEWIGWTDGESQVNRYKLSNNVSKIELINDGEGKYHLTAYNEPPGSEFPIQVFNQVKMSATEVANHIGEELSEKLISDLNSQADPISGYATIEGANLDIGGKGMYKFYDDILPKELGRYVKQWGGKVEKSNTGEPDVPSWDSWHLKKYGQEVDASLADAVIDARYRQYEKFLKTLEPTPIWRINITPEMRSGVQAGQARFMPERLNEEHAAAYKAGDENTARKLVRQAAEQAGYTRNAKHGTTHNFTVFNTSSANIENDMGKGFYFSTSPKDVESNYAGKGPDLTNRVERLAEEIYNGWDNDEVDAIGGEDAAMREARQEAEQSLVGGEQRVIDAFINFKKPLIIGGKEETEFKAEFESEDSEPTGSIMELVESVQNKADEYQAAYEAQDAISKLMELGMDYGTVSAREAVDIIKKSFENVYDPDTGDLAVNEFTREVFQNAGFDGIVDNTVNEKFGKRRKYGQTMAGIDENTQHIIAFNSESIKSADPFTYDDAGNLIPLSERFNSSTGDIRFMPERPTRGININDKTQDFTGQILRGEKTIETRDQKRSLAPYVGKRVGIISTGKGPAMLRGLADLGEPIEYKTPEEFRAAQGMHQVTPESLYDIKEGKSKFGYPLSNIEELPVPQPIPPSGLLKFPERFTAASIEGIQFMPESSQPSVAMPKTAQEEKQKVSIVIGAKAGEHGFSFTTVADLKDRVQKYEGQKAAIETVGELQDKKEKLMAMLKKAKPDKQAGYQTKIDALTKEIRQISKEIPEIIRRISPEKAAYKLRAKRIASMVNGLEMEATPAPFTAPTQGIRDMAELGDSVHDILLSEGFRNLSKDFFGVEGLEVEPISGTWKGKVEPSFVLSGPELTFEKAAEITKVLSFAFAQDAGITYRPSIQATEGIPAAYLIHGEQLSQDQLKLAFDKAIEVGVDISTTPDGLGIKALNFDVEDFASKIAEIQKAAAIDSVYNTLVDSDLYETKKDFSGSMGQRSQPVWLQASAAGQPLLQRSIDSLLVPYAKATAAQGYIFEPELFAKRFGLDGSVVEYINDRLYPAEIESRSASPLLDGREVLNVRSTYTAAGKRETAVPDMIHALQMRSAQNGVIQPGDYSERAGEIVSSVIADEVEQHMRRAALNPSAPNAIGWYDAALKRMKAKYSELFPFLKVGSPEYNADKSFVFDCVLGITSQGNDVFENGKMATRVCLMLEDGKSLSEIVKTLSETFGNQTRAIENNLLKLEALLAQNSPTELRDLMLQSDTVSNWNKRLKSSDNLFYQDAPLKVKGGSKQVVTGFMVFGPKIGSFINNLHGDYSTLTADLWYTRTWNRMIGRSFQYDPALEANQFDTFKEYLLEEYNRNEAKKNGVRYKDRVFESSSGTKTKFEYGKDAPDISRTEFEQLLNDDNAMLALADQLESKFRKGGYKIKSDLRRAAKNWVQGRKLPEAAPRTDLERTFQQKTMEAAQEKLRSMGFDISIADMQAALWYNEKELFQKYGAANSGAEPADYATAADFISQLIQAGALFQVDRKNKTVRLVPDSMEAKLTKVTDPDRNLMKRLLAEEKARKEAEKARKKAEGEEEEGDED